MQAANDNEWVVG